jgi:CSLREA domain-containing protein
MVDDRAVRYFLPSLLLISVLATHACVPTPNCSLGTYIPTKFDDSFDGVCDTSDCSLRDAVNNANLCPGLQTIQLAVGEYTLTITGANEDDALTGDLDIKDDLIILGAGGNVSGTRIRTSIDRVFDVFAPAVVEIEGLVVHTGNEANGGGLRNDTDLTLSDVFFLETEAVDKGGGVYNTGTLVCDDCSFYETEAEYGGGIANDSGGDLQLTNLDIHEASEVMTAEEGGGLWNASGAEATLVGFEIFNNYGVLGGGIYNAGDLEIREGALWDNQGSTAGGGIYTQLGGTTIAYDVRLTENHAGWGGGLYNKGLTHLYQSEVSLNGGGQGAGIYNDGAVPGVRLQNVTVSGNTINVPPPSAGAGIFNSGGDMLLEFITVANNDPYGITNVGGGTFTIESSIVAYNVSSNCVGTGSPSLGHNIDDDGSCNFTSFNDLSALDPLIADLHFNGASTMTHALFHGSPALNSGDLDTCIAEDQRGVSRPEGPRCDRGAYEGFVMQSTAPQITPLPPLLTATATIAPTLTPTPTATLSACFYQAAMNAYCRVSDYKESTEIALLLEGDEVELLALNPEFTHGQFLVESGRECWIWLGLLTGPENPYGTCDVPIIDPQPPPEDEAPPCREDMGEVECLASGGTWQEGATRKPSCICPD